MKTGCEGCTPIRRQFTHVMDHHYHSGAGWERNGRGVAQHNRCLLDHFHDDKGGRVLAEPFLGLIVEYLVSRFCGPLDFQRSRSEGV
jgi:hypothetical protein